MNGGGANRLPRTPPGPFRAERQLALAGGLSSARPPAPPTRNSSTRLREDKTKRPALDAPAFVRLRVRPGGYAIIFRRAMRVSSGG